MDRAVSFQIEDHLLASDPHLLFVMREDGKPCVRVAVPLSSDGRDLAISLEAAGIRLRRHLEGHLCRGCREEPPTGNEPFPDLCVPCARRAARRPGATSGRPPFPWSRLRTDSTSTPRR